MIYNFLVNFVACLVIIIVFIGTWFFYQIRKEKFFISRLPKSDRD